MNLFQESILALLEFLKVVKQVCFPLECVSVKGIHSDTGISLFLQILIWSAIRNSRADHNNNALALIVLIQYIPRLYLIFPLSYQIVKADGVVTKTAWAGAAYNLLLYMIASHVSKPIISFMYLSVVESLKQSHMYVMIISYCSMNFNRVC